MFNMNSRLFIKEVNLDTALAQLRNEIKLCKTKKSGIFTGIVK